MIFEETITYGEIILFLIALVVFMILFNLGAWLYRKLKTKFIKRETEAKEGE